jgi:hypothetical protein
MDTHEEEGDAALKTSPHLPVDTRVLRDHYDAFVSHNRVQKQFARELVGQLRQNFHVFFDEDDVPLRTPDLLMYLKEAIARSKRVLLLLSPSALASNWVAAEAYEALLSEGNGNAPDVMILQIEPTPEERIPEQLRRKPRCDLSEANVNRDHAYTSFLRELGLHGSNGVHTPPASRSVQRQQRVKFIFEIDRQKWTPELEEIFRQLLDAHGGRQVKVVSITSGSTVIEVEGELDEAKLLEAARTGAFARLNLREVQVEDASGRFATQYRKVVAVTPVQSVHLASDDATTSPAYLFQQAHGKMTLLQRLDAQLTALLEQRRLIQDELTAAQAQINDEFDRIMRQAEEAPARLLAELAQPSSDLAGAERASAAPVAEPRAPRVEVRIAEGIRHLRANVGGEMSGPS